MGRAYLRYSFTKGTVQEIDFLMKHLDLKPGHRVLDVGCGPGRHAHELARRGVAVHGIDISQDFIDIANEDAVEGSTFERFDARSLGVAEHLRGFDAVICLCQGAFGLMTAHGDDETVVRGMAQCLRRGGLLALSAFNGYFAVKYHVDATFDALRGVSHEVTEIRNTAGEVRQVDLWTGCYTPRELRLLLSQCGFTINSISSVEPGVYVEAPPTVETPEFLVRATKN
ncbi:MAG: methyltransferase domain-containing protein [Actinobacteria bacterium]|nr:methyltransferase domain-containing protein [Actinomycetota bacterium]MSX15033.1 methyltransferase domain-containing protein [Actinomycetota bacterium]MSX35856.1 methyltransferase domain-containing protein [Actinomycetota bacterium]MSX76760.1 methyltransferase domain-containing protein [Actinomycetota bacterium]MSZ70986.1 methyltransferase domain-containing protein [Actinomycetota bacterium]